MVVGRKRKGGKERREKEGEGREEGRERGETEEGRRERERENKPQPPWEQGSRRRECQKSVAV